jgi:hypothetical protein
MAKKETQLIVPDEIIMNTIYFIRGQKVMQDKDLAKLYRVTTGRLNEAVKRNLKRFPDDFMFQFNETETKNLISQIATSSWGGTRKLPLAFTEQGVAMLSGILSSDRAIAVNIQTIRIFTRIRQLLLNNTKLRLAIEEIKRKQITTQKILNWFFNTWTNCLIKKKNQIGFKIKGK